MEASPLDTRSRMSDIIHEVLHNGDPITGWAGCQTLTMTHSRLHGWELWNEIRTPEGVRWEAVASQRVRNSPLNMTTLVKELASRDSFGSRGVSHVKQIEDYLAKVDQTAQDKEDRFVDKAHDATAKTMYAVAKASGYKPQGFW